MSPLQTAKYVTPHPLSFSRYIQLFLAYVCTPEIDIASDPSEILMFVDLVSDVYLNEMLPLYQVVDKKFKARKAMNYLLILCSPTKELENRKGKKGERKKECVERKHEDRFSLRFLHALAFYRSGYQPTHRKPSSLYAHTFVLIILYIHM